MCKVKRVVAALFFVVLELTGCSAVSPLSPEYSGNDSARVRFVEKSVNGSIYLYPENDCNGGVSVVASGRSSSEKMASQHMLDPLFEGEFDLREMSFAPGKTVNVGFIGLGARGFLKGEFIEGKCVSGLSFVAAASSQYEVVHSGADLYRQCIYSVNRLQYDDGKVLRIPVLDVRPLICRGK